MYKVLLHISSWTFSLPHIEMMFHALVTSFFPLIIFVVESMLSFRIIALTLIVYRVDFMSVIFGTRNLRKLFGVCKVSLISKAHGNSIVAVCSRVAGLKAWL